MVLQGLDVLEKEDFKLLEGKKIGLITNYSFVDRNMNLGLDLLLKHNIEISKIFTPEHGFFSLPDGQEYEDSVHPKYGIKLVSLFGKKKKPDPSDLEDVDLLVYDIQDVGLRYYTFIYTLAYTLESAEENGIPYIVLDRVNPLGGYVFGPRISRNLDSFVGAYELSTRYGLTSGELALYFKKLKNLDVELKIVKLEGWNREMLFNDTDLLWNVPSPGIPTFETLLCYAGMCFLEGTNLSEGRGTTKPFQYVGSPWLNSFKVYDEMKQKNIEGAMFRKREFIPMFHKYEGELCWGIEFIPSSPSVNFFKISFEFLTVVSKIHGDTLNFDSHFTKLVGDERAESFLRKGEYEGLFHDWLKDEEEFMDFVDDVLIYPGKLRHLRR